MKMPFRYGCVVDGEYYALAWAADAAQLVMGADGAIADGRVLAKVAVAEGTRCAVRAGADFIKSSTGFFTGKANVGATVEVVRTMMEAGGGRIKVKGSGCIRTREHFLELIDMGIDRMGIGYRSNPVVLGLAQ